MTGSTRDVVLGFGIDHGLRGDCSGDAPTHGQVKLGRRGAGRSVEGIDIRSPHPLWKIGSVGRRRFRNGGALIPVGEMRGGRSLPGRRGTVPRRLCGILIFVEEQSKIQNRWRRRGKPPFLVERVHGDRSHKANDSRPGLVVVVVKDFGAHSFDANRVASAKRAPLPNSL